MDIGGAAAGSPENNSGALMGNPGPDQEGDAAPWR